MDVFDLQAKISLNVDDYVNALKDAMKQAENAKTAMYGMESPLTTNNKRINQLSDSLDEANKNLEEAKKETQDAAKNVDRLSDELKESTKTTGENSDETKALAEELENAKIRLQECEDAERTLSDTAETLSHDLEDARNTTDELSESVSDAGESADSTSDSVSGMGDDAISASNKFETLISTLENMGSTVADVVGAITQGSLAITGAVASATTGSMAAVVGGTAQLAAYGDVIDKQSQKIGISAQAYQEWDAIMQHSGSSVGSMIASMRTLVNAAQSDSDALKALGISQKEALSMGQEELFSAVITKLQNMEDKTQRTALATKLLGRGAMEFGALLNTSAEDTQKMRDRVHELGGVLTDVAVKDAAHFQDMLQDVKTGLSGLKNNLLSEFLPSMATVMEGVSDILAGEDGIKKINGGLDDIQKNFDNAFNNVVGIIEKFTPAVEKLVPIVADVFNKISASMIDSVLNVDVETAIDKTVNAFNTGFDGIKGIFSRLPDIINRGLEVVSDQKTISAVIGSFESVGASIADAFTSAITKLPDLLDSVFPYLNNVLKDVISWVSDNVPVIIDAAIDTADSLLSGSLSIIDTLFTSDNLSKLLSGVMTTIQKVADFIGRNLGPIMNTASNVIDAVADTLYSPELLQKFLDTGEAVIVSLIDGLTSGNNLQKLLDSVLGIVLKMQEVFTEPDVISAITEAASVIVFELGKGLMQALPQIASSTATFCKKVVDYITNYDWEETGIALIEGFVNGFNSMDWSFLDDVDQKWVDFWNGVASYWSEKWGTILSFLGESSVSVSNWVSDVVSFINDIPANVDSFIEGVTTSVDDFFTGIVESAALWFGNLMIDFGEFMAGYGQYLDDGIAEMTSGWTGFWESIGAKLAESVENLKSKWDQFWTDLGSKASDKIAEIVGFFQDIPNKLQEMASNSWSWGSDMLQNFVNGIWAKMPNLSGAVTNIASMISNLLGHSHPKEGPLAKDYTWMPDMMNLFADGIRANAGKVESEITSLAESMRPDLDYTATVSAGYGSVSPYSAYTGTTGAGVSPSLETIVSLLNGILVATQEGHYVSVSDIDTALGRRQADEIRRGI